MPLHPFAPRLGLARGSFLVALAAVGLAAALLRPVDASAVTQGAPPAKDPPQGKPEKKDDKKEEENGGDIVFQVINKQQKNSVLYSHEEHLSKGLECEDCHEKVFQKKINGNKFRMKDINDGKFCGACHTEKPAADVKHAAFAPKKNCNRCHNVRVREPDSK